MSRIVSLIASSVMLLTAPLYAHAGIVGVDVVPMVQPTPLGSYLDWALWGGEGEPLLTASASKTEGVAHPLSYVLQTSSAFTPTSGTWATFTNVPPGGGTTAYATGYYQQGVGVDLSPLGDFAGYEQTLTLWLWDEGGEGSASFTQGSSETGPVSLGTSPVAVTLRFTGTEPVTGFATGGPNAVSIGGAAYGAVAVPEPPMAVTAAVSFAVVVVVARKKRGGTDAS